MNVGEGNEDEYIIERIAERKAEMQAEIDNRKIKNRRRMAWISFVLMAVFGIGLISLGLTDDAYANRIEKMGFLLGTLLGCWAGVILAYCGAAAYENGKMKR